MLSFFFSFALGASALSLAPLITVPEPVQRNGLRLYSVVFSSDAPRFGTNLERLRNWVRQDLSAIDSNMVHDSWSIGNFTGFPAWLSLEGLDQLRQHSYISYIEEGQKRKVPQTWGSGPRSSDLLGASFTTRNDWGCVHSTQTTLNLPTTPPDWFSQPDLEDYGYPDGGAQTYTASDPVSWSWNGVECLPPNLGERSIIWILDTGVVTMHDEFVYGNPVQSRVTVRVNCAQDAGCVPEDPAYYPEHKHGTHCAGTAAGVNRGLAKGATIGSVRVFAGPDAEGYSSWTISAMNYVAANKMTTKYNVVSMSLGGSKSNAENDAVQGLWDVGVSPVSAAGNEDAPACDSSPASAPASITVGAIDALDARAVFSNYDSCVGIFAPGVSIHSSTIGPSESTSTYETLDGTSMATPLVAGAVALYVDPRPNSTPQSVRDAIYQYSRKNQVTDPKGSANRRLYAKFLQPPTEEEGQQAEQ